MAEIKSFREYIEEQKLFEDEKEDKDVSSNTDLKSENKPDDVKDNKENDIEPDQAEEKPSDPPADSLTDSPVLHTLDEDKLSSFTVTGEYLKNLLGDYSNQQKRLEELSGQIKQTIDSLKDGSYIIKDIKIKGNSNQNKEDTTQEPLVSKNKSSEPITSSNLPLNVTGGESIYSIVRDFKKKWNAAINDARTRKLILQRFQTLKHPGIINRYKTQKNAAEDILKSGLVKDEQNYFTSEKEGLLNEIILRTSGEIASGIGNKYNTSKILKKTTHGNLENIMNINNDTINSIRDKYRDEAFKIIKKDIGYSINYYNAAVKKLNRYKSLTTYLPKGLNDKAYLNNIFDTFMQAIGSITRIGSNLRSLNTECSNAVNRIYNELVYQDTENRENIPSHDNQVALNKFVNKEYKRKAKEQKRLLKKAEKDAEEKETLNYKEGLQKQLDEIKLKKKAMSDLTKDYILDSISGARKNDRKYINSDLALRIASDAEEDNKNFKTATNKYEIKLEVPDKKRASAIASSVLLNLIQQHPNTLNKMVFGDNPKEDLETVFDDYFNEAYKNLNNKSVKEFNKDTLDKLNNSKKETSSKQKKIGQTISDTTSAKKKAGNLLSKTIENVGKSSVNSNRVAMAKDFDGEAPESSDEPQPKNIFDYAVQKAKKLQER